jgi:hypothetical protein
LDSLLYTVIAILMGINVSGVLRLIWSIDTSLTKLAQHRASATDIDPGSGRGLGCGGNAAERQA